MGCLLQLVISGLMDFFEGKLNTTGKLVIGESGKLVGDVIAKSCDIWGTLQGKVIERGLRF